MSPRSRATGRRDAPCDAPWDPVRPAALGPRAACDPGQPGADETTAPHAARTACGALRGCGSPTLTRDQICEEARYDTGYDTVRYARYDTGRVEWYDTGRVEWIRAGSNGALGLSREMLSHISLRRSQPAGPVEWSSRQPRGDLDRGRLYLRLRNAV